MPIVLSRKASRTADPKATLAWQIKTGLGVICEQEWKFHLTRKWRFDLALPLDMLAIEIEGGIFMPSREVGALGTRVIGGRHNLPAGMEEDLIKYAEATCLGWRILRILPKWVVNGKAFGLVERALKVQNG